MFCCVAIVALTALSNVPSSLPSDIVKMDLSRNNIQHLSPKQFLLSKDLKLLNLSSNNLRHIDTGGEKNTETFVPIGNCPNQPLQKKKKLQLKKIL